MKIETLAMGVFSLINFILKRKYLVDDNMSVLDMKKSKNKKKCKINLKLGTRLLNKTKSNFSACYFITN